MAGFGGVARFVLRVPREAEVVERDEVVAVDEGGRGAGAGEELHRLDGFAVLEEARVGRVVGEEEPVHDERRVVHFLAKVPAVAVVLVARRLVLGQEPVVGPFPREAALAAGVFVEHVDVFLDISWTVAHGVDLLAVS